MVYWKTNSDDSGQHEDRYSVLSFLLARRRIGEEGAETT